MIPREDEDTSPCERQQWEVELMRLPVRRTKKLAAIFRTSVLMLLLQASDPPHRGYYEECVSESDVLAPLGAHR